MTRCDSHPRVVAAWRCDGCRQALCEDCAAPDRMGKLPIARCVHCGHMGQQLFVYRDIRPFWRMVRPFARAVVTGEGLIQLLAIAVVMLLFDLALMLGFFLQALILVTWYLRVVRHAAHGGEDVPDPSADELGGLLGSLLRMVVVSIWVWLPALFWYRWTSDFFSSPVTWVLGLYATALFPAFIIAASTSDSVLELLNPWPWVRIVRRVGREYVWATLLWLTLVVGDYLLHELMALTVGRLPVPVVTNLVDHVVGLVLPTLSALLLGRLIFQNGELFGVLTIDDRRLPQVSEPIPRAEPVARTEPEDASEPEVGLELTEVAPATAWLSAPPPLIEPPGDTYALDDDELPTDYGLRGEVAEAPPLTLAEALSAGNDIAAVQAWEQICRFGGVPALDGPQQLALGGAMVRAERTRDAARLFRELARQGGAEAPTATVRLAALMLTDLGRPDKGLPLLRKVVSRYPDHPAAADATRLLELHDAA